MTLYDSLNFEKNKKIGMKKVVGEQDILPFRCALSTSDILQVIAHNLNFFRKKTGHVTLAAKGLLQEIVLSSLFQHIRYVGDLFTYHLFFLVL